MLYRATAKTFQSPRVMRHLIYALEASGDYVDAERSLDAYIFLVENGKKTLAKARHQDREVENEELLTDIDPDDDVLRTMAHGVRLLVKFLNKGKKALDFAQTMEVFAKSWNMATPTVLASVWHAIGIANSLWSMQSTPLG